MERESTITSFDDNDKNTHCQDNHHEEKMEEEGKQLQQHDLLKKEMASETSGETTGERTDNEEDESEDEGYFADVGFVFEEGDQQQPTRVEHFEWNGVSTPTSSSSTKQPRERSIHVKLRVVDGDNPERIISGHYLWPAAKVLADHIVQHQHSAIQPSSVVELGAGCALLSCVALQLWQPTLECIVVTDHDPGTLERARDNYESTVQVVLDRSVGEDELNAAINDTASIHFAFYNVSWGDEMAIRKVRTLLGQHQTRKETQQRRADVVLASDVLYDVAVIEPLLQTAKDLLTTNGVLWLAQSSNHNNDIPDEVMQSSIATACNKLGMEWKTLVDQRGGVQIHEFRLAGEIEYSNNSFDEEQHDMNDSAEDKVTTDSKKEERKLNA